MFSELTDQSCYSEWLDPWSSASNTPSPADLSPTDLTDFDAHQLSLQLESFFSQDPLEEGAMAVQSPFYDEMTFGNVSKEYNIGGYILIYKGRQKFKKD